MRASARADVAIMNGGGIRAGKVYAPGTTLTRRDILAEMPFNNRMVTIEVSGNDLRRAIENGLALLPNASGRFPQVSGITVEADLKRPPGSRVVAIKVGALPLDDDKLYRLATNDFMARGGDGYGMLRDAKQLLPVDDSPLLANEIMAYLRRIGAVRSGIEGRMILR
jgi:2',3'-cyclic-nucleotide 2'-phosphodiesterase (5'-nucleotidase family)